MIFETKVCTGCKTCEIACAYHHEKAFSTSASSIEIVDRPEELGFAVLLHEGDSDGHPACDGCRDEAGPFCVRYCPELAQPELSGIVQRFRRGGA